MRTEITINACGLPIEVTASVAGQVKQARAEHPEASALLSSFKDFLCAEVSKADPGTSIQVSASIDFSITTAGPVESEVVETESQSDEPPRSWRKRK